MNEAKLPPQQPHHGEVPHASKVKLYDEVARLNVPYLDSGDTEHPMSKLLALMQEEHPAILRWGSDVSRNLNVGFGGSDEYQTNEKMAFDNAFVTAYALVRVAYEEAGREIPGALQPPEWYMWMRDEPEQTIPEMFETLDTRQLALAAEYPDMVDALQTWAADRIRVHGEGLTAWTVAVAAAEMFYAFAKTEETVALETMFERSSD